MVVPITSDNLTIELSSWCHEGFWFNLRREYAGRYLIKCDVTHHDPDVQRGYAYDIKAYIANKHKQNKRECVYFDLKRSYRNLLMEEHYAASKACSDIPWVTP